MPEQTTDPFSRIANYYGDLIRKYGHHPRACDYGRVESQQIKFRVLSEVTPLDNCSLLDVGCGFADFATFLDAGFSGIQYSGIDLCPDMVREARRSHPDLDLRVGNFAEEKFSRRFDVVTANGIFYLLGGEAWPMMRHMVAQMFSLATTAMAFNSLSSWAHDREADEFYADPLKVVEFCRTLTPWVVMRHDYNPRDFTMYLYKAPIS